MTGPPRSRSRQASHVSEEDYTTSFPGDTTSFYSGGEWMGSLPTGTVNPMQSSTAGPEMYMPAAFDPRDVNTFLMPNPYSDPSTLHTATTSYYASPASTTSDPSFLPASESPSAAPADNGEEAQAEKKPKRNRANRYKNAHPSVLSRRRAQNRESQRAYRRRKDDRIDELEQLLGEATDREQTLSQAYVSLKAEYDNLLVMGSSQGSNEDDIPAGFLSPPQAMMAMAYGTTAGSKNGYPHSSSQHAPSGMQFLPQMSLDGPDSTQLLAQLRSGADLAVKDSLKVDFGRQLMQRA